MEFQLTFTVKAYKLSWISQLVFQILYYKQFWFSRSTVRLKISDRNIIGIWVGLSNWNLCFRSSTKRCRIQAQCITDIIRAERQQLIIVLINWHFQWLYRGRKNAKYSYRPCSWNRSRKYVCILNTRKGYTNGLVGIASTMNHHFNKFTLSVIISWQNKFKPLILIL